MHAQHDCCCSRTSYHYVMQQFIFRVRIFLRTRNDRLRPPCKVATPFEIHCHTIIRFYALLQKRKQQQESQRTLRLTSFLQDFLVRIFSLMRFMVVVINLFCSCGALYNNNKRSAKVKCCVNIYNYFNTTDRHEMFYCFYFIVYIVNRAIINYVKLLIAPLQHVNRT